jgi:hypothetical protein
MEARETLVESALKSGVAASQRPTNMKTPFRLPFIALLSFALFEAKSP